MEERRIKTTLTLEESARLIELGVDPKMASECVSAMKVCASGRGIIRLPESNPIFTLTDLLSILPKSYFSEEYYAEMNLSIAVLNGKWFVDYRYYSGGELAAQDVGREAPELIDALNKLAIWCLENNHIKTEKK